MADVRIYVIETEKVRLELKTWCRSVVG